jgi:NADPH:quinone reductase-like Zn-dependent oxidoreductase
MGLIFRGQALARFARQRILVPVAKPNRENLAALRELIESGKVAPVIDRTYPLDQVPEAIRYLEVEHARAKVVIAV